MKNINQINRIISIGQAPAYLLQLHPKPKRPLQKLTAYITFSSLPSQMGVEC